jgi:hypothetical protein
VVPEKIINSTLYWLMQVVNSIKARLAIIHFADASHKEDVSLNSMSEEEEGYVQVVI